MKKNILKVLALTSVTSLVLTGCFLKKLSQDEFLSRLDDVKGQLTLTNEKMNDIHINNKLNVNVYNYKEGEFYAYKMFALILIVPVTEGEYIYKQDGKFYQIKTHTDSKKDTKTEISEEQFNILMLERKQSMIDRLMMPVNTCEGLINGTTEQEYKSVKNTFKGSKKKLQFVSNVTFDVTTNEYNDETGVTEEKVEEKKGKFTITFESNLPKKYINKTDDGETTWDYCYGKAELNLPEIANS